MLAAVRSFVLLFGAFTTWTSASTTDYYYVYYTYDLTAGKTYDRREPSSFFFTFKERRQEGTAGTRLPVLFYFITHYYFIIK